MEQIPPQRGRTKIEVYSDGSARERFVGRDRRGAPSREDRDQELLRDAGYARVEIEKFERAFVLARSPEVAELPKAQRDEARALAVSHLDYASRFIDTILDELK